MPMSAALQAYSDAMAVVAGAYPDDNEAAVLYGESLMNLRPWDYWTEQGDPQPGIAEALIATAMGLFAAIPAVIAYNRFSNTAERLLGRYEIFAEEFLSIVNRQS